MSQETELIGRSILVNKGNYNNLTTYNKLDIVIYNDISFVAKQTTIGHAPIGNDDDNYWVLLGGNRTYVPSLTNNILHFK